MATGGGGAVSLNGVGSGGTVSNAINLQALQTFHQRCGRRITLSNGNRTAARSIRDFSHALVFSAEPLTDDVLFEVVIEKKNHAWGGSIEIGVTAEPPDKLELPSCATAMRNGTWVMSGIDVRKDGVCLIEFYGTDLESLGERDRVGVMRTSHNELVFFVNGESQGVAARNMPKTLWALVDLYGRCVQVSLWPTDFGGSGDYADGSLQQAQPIVQNIDVPMGVDVTVASAASPTTNNTCAVVNHNGGGLVTANAEISAALSNLCSSSVQGISAIPQTCFDRTLSVSASTAAVLALQPNLGDFYDMDRLRFHTRCGSLVKLSPHCRCAERRRPLDEFNNGVVMTHRPLKDNELFEIRIDKLVDKWSGSIEVGVTTHNPSVLHFPATMTNMRSGTIMMSGCGILTNGKGTRRQYGEFNLDELREGDRVGMMRKSNGSLHYYINGQDQGVAATRVAQTLWGVIDLYGMTIKVTIVDPDDREQQNLVTRRNNIISASTSGVNSSASTINNASSATNALIIGNTATPTPMLSLQSPEGDTNSRVVAAAAMGDAGLSGGNTQRNEDRLTFHPTCGSHATVTLSGRTALRPNASDDFNNGVVLTRRPLRPNELFQVRLERVVTKWAGSVEMGVTTHSAEELDFPFTMTNVRSGTWMMTGNGVMHNGITVIEQYGQNLDRLQVGDRVGVVRKDDGTLHFWVNGVDQGAAATGVPEKVYGVIDLYGQAAQASIVDTSECASPDTGNSTISNTTLYSEPPLRFHTIHGKNAGISNGGLTASRPNSLAEFNDAIVFSNRPLRNRELFEVVLESMVRHWSGNIEIGVTGTRPEDIQLAANATDLDANDMIILCGSMIFQNRKTIRSNTTVDLDTLSAGTRVGVMRNGDYVHFFIDGVDQGPACECRMPSVWAVIDLYGQCAQVTLTQVQPDIRAPYATSENSQSCQATSVIQPATSEMKHRWTCISGNVTLSQSWTVASRNAGASAALSRCVVFSEHPLSVGSPFEIKVISHNPLFAGCLSIGVTDLNLSDDYVRKNIPLSIKRIPANVWYASGNEVRHNSTLLQRSMASLEWLRVGDRIALELTPARTLRILLNSEDMNIHFHNVPNDIYVVAELQGSTMAVQTISTQGPNSPLRPCSLRLQDSLDFGVDPLNKQDSMLDSIDSEMQVYEFSELHGKHIRLLDDRHTAMRTQSYNQGVVLVGKPLMKGESISIKVEAVNPKWKGTIGLGVVSIWPHSMSVSQMPISMLHFKRPCWLATHDYININGQKIASRYGEALEQIQAGTVITMTLSNVGMLVIMVGSINLEDLAAGVPNNVYPVFDLYGKCEKISLITTNDVGRNSTPIIEEAAALEYDNLQEQDNGVPQCEKADLEMHEKETEQLSQQQQQAMQTSGGAVGGVAAPSGSAGSSAAMNRSVMESVSENLLLNISIKNRTLEQNRSGESSAANTSCCLRESLQLQHNTNLNIQRSQSTQRFQNAMNASANSTALGSGAVADNLVHPSTSATAATANHNTTTNTTTTNTYVHDTNKDYEAFEEAGAVGGVSLQSELRDCNSKENLLEQRAANNLDALEQLVSSVGIHGANANAAAGGVGPAGLSNNNSANERNTYEDDTNLAASIFEATTAITSTATAVAGVDTNVDVLEVATDGRAYEEADIDDADDVDDDDNDDDDDDDLEDNDNLDHLLLLQQQQDFFRQRYQQLCQQHFGVLSSASSSTQFDSLQSIPSIERKDCEYLKLVQQFRASLVLPQSFFQPLTDPVCFCTHCNALASEKLHGWVYFKLNQQTVNSTAVQQSLDTGEWLPLYYMTRVDKIRAILDRGQPLPLESNCESFTSASNQKDEPGTRLELHFSPNAAGIVSMNGQHKYYINSHAYSIGTAFEVYVRRQSLCLTNSSKMNVNAAVAASSSAAAAALSLLERRSSSDLLHPHETSSGLTLDQSSSSSGGAASFSAGSTSSASLKDITWFTKEAGACVITALILKLDRITPPAIGAECN
uniref:Neuralized-like protein 4 n=1 Tax=Ceratitis capitata TaxID=7213 RepID=W8BLA2_CERCA